MISSITDNPMSHRRRQCAVARGFSLVELLIMGMVLLISAAIVIPSLGSGNYSVCRAGARRLASDLQYAQDAAISTQKDITVTIDVDTDSYWLSNESGPLIHPITNSAYTTDFKAIGELAGLDISKAGIGSVTFDPAGVPNASLNVLLLAGESRFSVDVSAVTGTVSVIAGD